MRFLKTSFFRFETSFQFRFISLSRRDTLSRCAAYLNENIYYYYIKRI